MGVTSYSIQFSRITLNKRRYELAHRLISLADNPPFSVRVLAGHSLKSSVRYVCKFDGRDNAVDPTRGPAFMGSTEVAGFGGDVRFLKQTLASQVFVPLYKQASLLLGLRAGYLLHKGASRPTERFFLNGFFFLLFLYYAS